MCSLMVNAVEGHAHGATEEGAGEARGEVSMTKGSGLSIAFRMTFDFALARLLAARRCSFLGSSTSGRGVFIGPSHAKALYIEGGDGGRECLDLDVELEVREAVLYVLDMDDGELEALDVEVLVGLGAVFEPAWDFFVSWTDN